MKTFKTAAAIVAASIAAFAIAPVFAQAHPASQGHYEWRQAAQNGPRVPLQAPKRVWVSEGAQVADCDCGMMKMSSADAATCMKAMPGMAPSGGSAS